MKSSQSLVVTPLRWTRFLRLAIVLAARVTESKVLVRCVSLVRIIQTVIVPICVVNPPIQRESTVINVAMVRSSSVWRV